MAILKVAIVGATGETGSSIVNGLLRSTEPRYDIKALIRKSSLEKPAVQALGKKGIKVIAADLDGPEAELVESLRGVDIVISAIDAAHLMAQISLANACKVAGVNRFVPCHFATIAPPKGVHILRDIKEDVLNHIRKLYLPYTTIDVGWWFQITLPRLPSGRNDYALLPNDQPIPGDGNIPFAITDIADIGIYTARIIADPRTLNHMVFAYNEIPAEKIEEWVKEAESKQIGPGHPDLYKLATFQYWNSWGIRGDNTPACAKYLGYLNTKELYPDLEGKSFEQYCQEVLDGKAYAVYKGNQA